MKYIKKYERNPFTVQQVGQKGYVTNKNFDLPIGEYVICEDSMRPYLNPFLTENIGEIKKSMHLGTHYEYTVKYDNIPPELEYNGFNGIIGERMMTSDEILYHSKIKKELEAILISKKYNL